jgi:hypothetical protein
VIQILGAFAFLGLLCSFLIPETMNQSLEKLAGEEAPFGGESEEEREHQQQSLWRELWSACTPYVLWQGSFSRRTSAHCDNATGEGEGRTGERISLSRIGDEDEIQGSERVRSATERELPIIKTDGGLKVMESEIERLSGESSDRRSHRDEIQRIL